jgi:vitamin B12 transporter
MTGSKTLFLTAASLLALTTAPFAQSEPTLLPRLVIAAGLSPFAEKEIGRSYTVIDAKALENSKAAYLTDVLRLVPGFAIAQTGAIGGKTDLRIRGAEANHVLVLIDGVPVSEGSDGAFDFARMQVSNVERIEILRGPQSAFWGSDALAGVVNIVTKSGGAQGTQTTLSTELGSDGTRMGSALVQLAQDNFDAAVSLTARHTDGFNVAPGGSELDGATHLDGNARFKGDINANLSIDGTIRFARLRAAGDNWDNGKLVDRLDFTTVTENYAALGTDWKSDDGAWFQKARVSYGYTHRDNEDELGFEDYTNTSSRVKGSYVAGYNFDTPDFANASHTVSLGYDVVRETFKNLESSWATAPEYYSEKSRTTQSLIGEYRGTYFDQLYLTAALRHDFNEGFKDATTYSISGAWDIPNTGTRLHTSVGTGFKSPTLVEQFGDFGTFVGNPDLIAEHSLGWDVGVTQTMLDGAVTLDATYFNQTLENEIKAASAWGNNKVTNLPGTAHRQGVELSANVDFFNGLTAGVSYTYTDAKDSSGNRATRRPEHSAALQAAYTFANIPLTLNGEVALVGEAADDAYDAAFNPIKVTLPAYALISAGASYQVNDTFEVYGRVHNLTDTAYQQVYGYNTQGRTFYLGAKAKF